MTRVVMIMIIVIFLLSLSLSHSISSYSSSLYLSLSFYVTSIDRHWYWYWCSCLCVRIFGRMEWIQWIECCWYCLFVLVSVFGQDMNLSMRGSTPHQHLSKSLDCKLDSWAWLNHAARTGIWTYVHTARTSWPNWRGTLLTYTIYHRPPLPTEGTG